MKEVRRGVPTWTATTSFSSLDNARPPRTRTQIAGTTVLKHLEGLFLVTLICLPSSTSKFCSLAPTSPAAANHPSRFVTKQPTVLQRHNPCTPACLCTKYRIRQAIRTPGPTSARLSQSQRLPFCRGQLITTIMADVPMQVVSENSVSERRINPAWTIGTLKTRLEPITGIPYSCQRLSIKASSGAAAVPLEAADEDNTFLSSFPLTVYGEIHVSGGFSVTWTDCFCHCREIVG